MNRRSMGLGLLAGLTVAASTLLAGCGGGDRPAQEYGTLRVPLSTQGQSGSTYRLRDAIFEIRSEYYYYASSGGEGGGGGSTEIVTVSSETDPDASSISVNVERGYYYVRLRPGWRMERVEGGVATEVEATLLSSATQWTYVGPHATSWLRYQFGIGDRALWFNGNLNLEIDVYENPSEFYGHGGEGGFSGAPSGVGGAP